METQSYSFEMDNYTNPAGGRTVPEGSCPLIRPIQLQPPGPRVHLINRLNKPNHHFAVNTLQR